MNEKCFYVYVHRRETDGAVFYVGKGKGGRLTHSYGKSKWWNSIANKHGWYAEKFKDGLSEECAYALEKILIFSNQTKLCNLASGGVGGTGFKKKSAEHIAKVALSQTGRPKQKSTRDKIAILAKARLADPKNHWRIDLVKALWIHKSGLKCVADHLEMKNKTGLRLESFKRVQSGTLSSYKGWSCHAL